MKTKEELTTEFEALKNKYGTVFTITAPLDDEGVKTATIFLKKADRMTHAIVNKLYGGADPSKAIEACLKGNYIDGDELALITNDDDALLACEAPLVEYLARRTASIKKN
ncbi:MAG: hypothetical protein K0S53_402 [Bacteroidetes bacterium]|jgi:hypothetical protein|nr:hypothetical protein [Bacteroidota bacterium]